MADFTLTSPSFSNNGIIPVKQSCDGTDASPALSWQGAPEGTLSLVLIVDDEDAAGFVHWIAYDIPGGPFGTLSEGIRSNDQLLQGRNDFGKTGYGGPCPPRGTPHHYRFTMYALSARPNLSGVPSVAEVRDAMADHILGEAKLTATYERT
jgi:Raf kinase inhibitor-like YbhB/YbcL family protein